MNTVHENVLESALREMGSSKDQRSEVMSVAEIEALLSKVFNRVNSSQSDRQSCELSIELTLCWILNCYDA